MTRRAVRILSREGVFSNDSADGEYEELAEGECHRDYTESQSVGEVEKSVAMPRRRGFTCKRGPLNAWRWEFLSLPTLLFCSGCFLVIFSFLNLGRGCVKSPRLGTALILQNIEPPNAPLLTEATPRPRRLATAQPRSLVEGVASENLMVEYAVAGNRVPLSDALSLDFPISRVEDIDHAALERKELTENPNGKHKVKLLIAITTACCTKEHQKKRQALRDTWIKDSLGLYDNVDIKFILGQPSKVDADGIQLIEDEVREHGDIYFVRGADSYDTLWSKTLGLFKYTLSAPEQYTHLMKTDDDVYVRVHRLLALLNDPSGEPQMTKLYKGCMENPTGFYTFRDPNSKWYFSYEQFDNATAAEIDGTFYLAGWGYLLSRDLVFHAMKKIDLWEKEPSIAPRWHKKMRMLEDVQTGVLVADAIPAVETDLRFRAPWQGCDAASAAVHLDIDAPRLVKGLYEQELNGLWEHAGVVCTSGVFEYGDYYDWLSWRNTQLRASQRI